MLQNNFGCCVAFECGEGTASIYSLEELQKKGIGTIDTLPFSIRILLEQAGVLYADAKRLTSGISDSCAICRKTKQPAHRPVVSGRVYVGWGDTLELDLWLKGQKNSALCIRDRGQGWAEARARNLT